MGKVKTRGIVISNNTPKVGAELEAALYSKAAELGASEVLINQFEYNKWAEVDMFGAPGIGLIGYAYHVAVEG